MPAVAPTGPRLPVVHAPTRSRIAAGVIALCMVPLAWLITTHGQWEWAAWMVPMLVLVALALGVLLGRADIPAAGPMAMTTMAVFSAALAFITLLLSWVDDDLLRLLIAAVPAVLIAAFAGPGIQQAAADVNGEWIVAVGVAIVALFISMMLAKVQMSFHTLHDGSGPEKAKPAESTAQVAHPVLL